MKVRRRIELKNEASELVASGVLYTEGNVQILWRQDIGDTGEQFNTIANLIGLCDAVSIHVDPCPDVKQDQIPLIPVGKPNVNTKKGE